MTMRTTRPESKVALMQVEDYDEKLDGCFVKECLLPYFRDIFRDLALRSFVS